MAIDYVMPKLAMAMNEGTINEWLVREGQHLEAGAPIAVIETEKVAYDCEAPESGFFLPIVAEGETVDVEVLIGCFCSEESELDAAREKYLAAGAAAAPMQEPAAAASATAARDAPPVQATPADRQAAPDRGARRHAGRAGALGLKRTPDGLRAAGTGR